MAREGEIVGSLGIDGRALLLRGRTQEVGEIHLGKSRGDALRGEDVRLNKEESKTSCVGKPSSR